MKRFFCFVQVLLMFVMVSIAFGEEKKIDKDYIKEKYPDVYREIYNEGKEAGMKETDIKPKPSQEKTAAAEQFKPHLRDWWNHSSLLYKPMPEKLQFHAELQYAYNKLTGNLDVNAHSGAGKLVLRKGRFTDFVSYKIDKSKTVEYSTKERVEKDYRIFEESLMYDLTEKIYPEIGYIWEKDEVNYIDGRNIFYGGIGCYVLDMERHRLKVFAAYGLQDEKYMPIVNEYLGIKDDSTNLLYLYQNYDLQLTDNIIFHEGFRIIQGTKKKDEYVLDETGNIVHLGSTKPYRWIFDAGIDFKVNNFLYIVNSYTINYNNNPWPGVLKKDTRWTTGLRVSY